MKVSALVFACYAKSCAPPPAGHGGSSPSKGGGGGTMARQAATRLDTAERQTQREVKVLGHKLGMRFETTNDKGNPLPNHGSVIRHPNGYTAHIRRQGASVEVDAFMAPVGRPDFRAAARVHKHVVSKLSEDGSPIKRGPNSENWDKYL